MGKRKRWTRLEMAREMIREGDCRIAPGGVYYCTTHHMHVVTCARELRWLLTRKPADRRSATRGT